MYTCRSVLPDQIIPDLSSLTHLLVQVREELFLGVAVIVPAAAAVALGRAAAAGHRRSRLRQVPHSLDQATPSSSARTGGEIIHHLHVLGLRKTERINMSGFS